MLKASVQSRTFDFNFAARTSRGAMRDKKSWFLKIWDDRRPECFGLGECGPLPGLNPENLETLEALLNSLARTISESGWQTEGLAPSNDLQELKNAIRSKLDGQILEQNPSVAFAMETALLDLKNGGNRVIFDSSFTKGQPIPINGLVWMGGLDFMLQQVEIKIRDGFNCIKVKIGGLDFEKELDILQFMRQKYFRNNIIIRLDANGAFKSGEALKKLELLAKFNVHSVEQPLKAGDPFLAALCGESPVPIALDEELIGINETSAKKSLLDAVKPAYIILKPTLHGGLSGSAEWIRLAEERKIGWWITSALESNIGLNAVSQFAASLNPEIHQGLGTGSLYTNNIASPLEVGKGVLTYNLAENWGLLNF